MTAHVSENTLDSRPVRSRCACTEVRQCIVQLSCVCLWTSYLKKSREGTMLVHRGQCSCRVHSVNCSNWEYLHTCSTGSTCSKALSRYHPYNPSERLRSPSIPMFREEICSVVLLTDKRFFRIHGCIAKHRIPIRLSTPGPLRCRMSCRVCIHLETN